MQHWEHGPNSLEKRKPWVGLDLFYGKLNFFQVGLPQSEAKFPDFSLTFP